MDVVEQSLTQRIGTKQIEEQTPIPKIQPADECCHGTANDSISQGFYEMSSS